MPVPQSSAKDGMRSAVALLAVCALSSACAPSTIETAAETVVISCGLSMAPAEIREAESLEIQGCGDVDFRPLWEADRLVALEVSDPALRDITNLAGIRSLERVVLESSDVSDIAPLGPLERLREVVVVDTPLTDLSALARLPALERLDVSDSYVIDLGPLEGLASLHTLIAPRARIGDVSALATLPSLREVNLYDNGVADIAPLVANTGLGEGTSVNLVGNCLDLDDAATRSALVSLRARGVSVSVDPQKPDCDDADYFGR